MPTRFYRGNPIYQRGHAGERDNTIIEKVCDDFPSYAGVRAGDILTELDSLKENKPGEVLNCQKQGCGGGQVTVMNRRQKRYPGSPNLQRTMEVVIETEFGARYMGI